MAEFETSGYSNRIDLYGSDGVKSYDKYCEKEPVIQAFLCPAMEEFLKSEVPGKKVLDIGCGDGYWSYQAARYGAKSIDGFDVQEKMVTLARQATSQFNMVNIKVGDVMDMPYGDETFDVAMSLYVTCNLDRERLSKHFKELYRVLKPGGKAVIVNLAEKSVDKMYLTVRGDEVVVKGKINKSLKQLPKHPTVSQVNKAFQGLQEVTKMFFAADDDGDVYQVEDASRLSNGDSIWSKTKFLTFPNFFYRDQFMLDSVIIAGLSIDQIDDIYTEERMVLYNQTHPESQLSKSVVDHPLAYIHHVSKALPNC
ncbi:demethylmenaquinone methyltransferase-like [Dysidea avara]|uniref:demethylmenaquinone methyltransferase-like n=1 Tax=Dysidea avara TaxID=196820 RepID=UPI00332E679F